MALSYRSNHPFSHPKPPGSYGNIPCIACGHISDCYITKSVPCIALHPLPSSSQPFPVGAGCCRRYILFLRYVYISIYKRATSRPNASAIHFNNNNREPLSSPKPCSVPQDPLALAEIKLGNWT